MNILANFKLITTFIFDVDGVLTDNSILVTEKGNLLRRMNVKDGYAMKTSLEKGYKIFIITGGNSMGVVKRLNKLGIQNIFDNVSDKAACLNDIIKTFNLTTSELLYMGDDVMDIPAMKKCGMITCPLDAVPEVISIAHYTSPLPGGSGCVRDVIEKVLKLNGDW